MSSTALVKIERKILSPIIVVKDKWIPAELMPVLGYNPQTELGKAIVRFVEHHMQDNQFSRDAAAELFDRLASSVISETSLSVIVHRGALYRSGYPTAPLVEDHGKVGYKVVTTVGAAFLIDAWQNLLELEAMKFHGIGTGSGAEAAADTGLGTELTTEYNPNNTRATGTLTEGASSNIFRSVATNTLDGTPGANIQEHGLFSNATVGSGVLFDRTKFAGGGYALVSGDGLETPFEWTCATGG